MRSKVLQPIAIFLLLLALLSALIIFIIQTRYFRQFVKITTNAVVSTLTALLPATPITEVDDRRSPSGWGVLTGLFLAVLELVRHQHLRAAQPMMFGEIWLEPGEAPLPTEIAVVSDYEHGNCD